MFGDEPTTVINTILNCLRRNSGEQLPVVTICPIRPINGACPAHPDGSCPIYNKLGSWHYNEMHNRLNKMLDGLKKLDLQFKEDFKHDSRFKSEIANHDYLFEEVGYLLIALWREYEPRLIVHDTKVKGGQHEQEIRKLLKNLRLDRGENNNGITATEFRNRLNNLISSSENTCDRVFNEFGTNGVSQCATIVADANGSIPPLNEDEIASLLIILRHYNGRGFSFDVNQNAPPIHWGVYTDLVYDTHRNDWAKAYQITFHEFFHNIDSLAINGNQFFSHTGTFLNITLDPLGFERNRRLCSFGEIIQDDVNNLFNRVDRLEETHPIHRLEKSNKAYLYDTIGGARTTAHLPGRYGINAEITPQDNLIQTEVFGHSRNYWVSHPGGRSRIDLLAMETFANMASTAVVNHNALKEMRRYLPKSYRTFVEILRNMVRNVCQFCIECEESL